MSRYTWVVTKDIVLGDSSDAIGKIGPPRARGRASFHTVISRGHPFRLVEKVDEDICDPRYVGYILGKYQGPEPLVEFGFRHGCSGIEYKRSGRWKLLAEASEPVAAAVSAGGAVSARTDISIALGIPTRRQDSRTLLHQARLRQRNIVTTYAWVIVKGMAFNEASAMVFHRGSGAGHRMPLSAVLQAGRRFRLLKAGVPVLEGYIAGKFKGGEPLDDYGTRVGCTDIEYEQDGYWVTLNLARLAPRPRGLARAV